MEVENHGGAFRANKESVHVGISAPCKDCPDRHMACHSSCQKYISYREQMEGVSRNKSKLNLIEDDFRYRFSRMRNKNNRTRRR